MDLPAVGDEIVQQWQNVVEILARTINVPSAIITRACPPEIEVVRASTNPDNPYRAGLRATMANHYCEAVVTRGERLLLPDARKDPDWQNAPELEYGVVSYLGYPIRWPDGGVFGTICVLDRKEHQYSAEHQALLEQFRNLVEAHLALIRANEALEQKKGELKRRLDEIHALRGIIPICMRCKNVRNDEGYWERVEVYIRDRSDAEFSHGLCPGCAEALYGAELAALGRPGP